MTNAGKLTPNCSNNGLIDNYQQDGQNKGKCLLDQNLSHLLLLFHTAYFPASSLRSFLAFLLASKSSIAVNIMAAVQLCTILFSTLDCKVIPPSLFEFSQM